MQEIRQAVLETIDNAEHRLTLLDIERCLSRQRSYDRKAVRRAIKELVDQQVLMYVSDFGHTFIETSLHKPIRVTKSIILKPQMCNLEPGANDIVVSLCHGTSFGSGQHPTTRLCLMGLEFLHQKRRGLWYQENTSALDIGTGSGVLIITALKMGITSGVAIDIDPCAIWEARTNIVCNGLSEQVNLSSKPFETVGGFFHLIMANLRLPTLKLFLPRMVDSMAPGGSLLLSGLERPELESLVKQRRRLDLYQEWMGEERGWVAVVFNKKNG
jgi:ribosomal protein L11 methyltransferase